ncbi:MAG: minor capsid protein [Bacteroidaceae bacterium]|nr:minor capsid protein [Bacteroidaceae bacterium]
MMQTLYKEQGSQFRIELLETPKMQEFIETHADALNSGFQQVKMSDAMRQRLQRSNYIFSGMKTFHELNEAFPSLIDENGNRKPFEQFLNDVQKIDRTYNQNYLRAEYNFCQASADMAAKWEGFMQDGDRYNLQYRTQRDKKVRPEHAALDRVTLPMSDTFWQEYYPPNGWNCRCTVVQVRKSKYPETPHDEAMALGAEATGKDTKGIFHFNPGIEQKTIPDYNPYTIKRCRDCDIAKGLAPDGSPVGNKLVFVPDNELCAACRIVRSLANADAKQTRKQAKPLQGTAINTTKFPHPINISRASITEWTNQPNKHQQEKNKMLLRINEVFEEKECKYLGPADPPPGKERERVVQHHIFSTKVRGEEQCIIVWEWDWGEYTLHSISDHPEEIRKHIKKK